MRGSCIEQVQNDGPTLIVNKTSKSLNNCLLHRWVIKRGIANTWGICGCAKQSESNTSSTVYIAVGEGVQSLGLSCVCNWKQSLGDNLFRARLLHAYSVLYFHQELIQLTTRPPDLSSADSFRGMKSNGFWPVMISFKICIWDKPSIPDLFILVPTPWMTWRIHNVPISTNIILSTNPFSFLELECPL